LRGNKNSPFDTADSDSAVQEVGVEQRQREKLNTFPLFLSY
jgi:hypothetical protein